jgi:cyclase
VKEQVNAGKSIQEIQAQGVPKEWKDWGWRFISEERWILMLHTEATK